MGGPTVGSRLKVDVETPSKNQESSVNDSSVDESSVQPLANDVLIKAAAFQEQLT